MSAHDAVVALARDLVEEIAGGMAVELAMAQGGAPAAPPMTPEMVPPPRKGAAAVYPQLGASLVVPPGDTISGLAYAYMQPPQPPGGQAPIAGQ